MNLTIYVVIQKPSAAVIPRNDSDEESFKRFLATARNDSMEGF